MGIWSGLVATVGRFANEEEKQNSATVAGDAPDKAKSSLLGRLRVTELCCS